MYGNLTRDAAVFLPSSCSQICVLVQQTDQGVYYSTKISPLVFVKVVTNLPVPVFSYYFLFNNSTGNRVDCTEKATIRR